MTLNLEFLDIGEPSFSLEEKGKLLKVVTATDYEELFFVFKDTLAPHIPLLKDMFYIDAIMPDFSLHVDFYGVKYIVKDPSEQLVHLYERIQKNE